MFRSASTCTARSHRGPLPTLLFRWVLLWSLDQIQAYQHLSPACFQPLGCWVLDQHTPRLWLSRFLRVHRRLLHYPRWRPSVEENHWRPYPLVEQVSLNSFCSNTYWFLFVDGFLLAHQAVFLPSPPVPTLAAVRKLREKSAEARQHRCVEKSVFILILEGGLSFPSIARILQCSVV